MLVEIVVVNSRLSMTSVATNAATTTIAMTTDIRIVLKAATLQIHVGSRCFEFYLQAAPISVQWGQFSGIHELSFNADNQTVATSGTWCVQTWDCRKSTDNFFATLDYQKMLDIEVSPDSRRMLVCASLCGRWIAISDEMNMILLDAQSGKEMVSWKRGRDEWTENYDFAFHPDGNQLAASIDNCHASVWAIPSGKLLGNLTEHSQVIQAITYSNDGKRIATSSRGGTIKLWDTGRLQVVFVLQGFSGYGEAIAFSPGNQMLIGGLYDGSLKAWTTLAIDKRPKDQKRP